MGLEAGTLEACAHEITIRKKKQIEKYFAGARIRTNERTGKWRAKRAFTGSCGIFTVLPL